MKGAPMQQMFQQVVTLVFIVCRLWRPIPGGATAREQPASNPGNGPFRPTSSASSARDSPASSWTSSSKSKKDFKFKDALFASSSRTRSRSPRPSMSRRSDSLPNKTLPSQDFNLVSYPGDGHHQLIRIQVRARQVTLQPFGAEVSSQPGHKGSVWPARIHYRGQIIQPLHRLARPSSPACTAHDWAGLLVAKPPRVARHSLEARIHRQRTFRLLSNIGGDKTGGHGTIMAVAVAAAGRTGRRVRQPVPVRQSWRARPVSLR